MEYEETLFQDGDLVRLKDGGPVMTVRFPVGPLLLCAWIDAGGRARRATFAPEQLTLVSGSLPAWVAVAARLAMHRPIHICTF